MFNASSICESRPSTCVCESRCVTFSPIVRNGNDRLLGCVCVDNSSMLCVSWLACAENHALIGRRKRWCFIPARQTCDSSGRDGFAAPGELGFVLAAWPDAVGYFRKWRMYRNQPPLALRRHRSLYLICVVRPSSQNLVNSNWMSLICRTGLCFLVALLWCDVCMPCRRVCCAVQHICVVCVLVVFVRVHVRTHSSRIV